MFRLFRLGPKMRVYRGRTSLISHIRGVAQPQIEDKGRVPQKRQSACRVRQEQRRVANNAACRADPSPGGEPLRNVATLWLGQQAAPRNVSRCGSSMGPCIPPPGIDAMGKTSCCVIPGSRGLLTDRAALPKTPIQGPILDGFTQMLG